MRALSVGVYNNLREGFYAAATTQHRDHPQYEGYFDGWVLMEMKGYTATKGGVRLRPGDIVLADPMPTAITVSGTQYITYTVYDELTGHNVAVPVGDLRPVAMQRD